MFWPVAQSGWVDLVIQTPHGFNRVQVKTTAGTGGSIRVRGLGSTNTQSPADRYDLLAVVNHHRLWVIPSSALNDAESITIHTQDTDCPYAGYRKR